LEANKDLKNYVYKILHDKIVNCDYPPCSILNEAQLSKEFGFSRTPIREAISRLEQDGFLKVLPKKGLFVTNTSLEDVMQVFQTRIEIEPIAVRLASSKLPKEELLMYKEKFSGEEGSIQTAFRLDTDMHLFIIEHCGNKFIIEMMKKVFDVNTRIIISSKQNQYKIHDARQEHLNILDLLLNGKYTEAAQYMREHIINCEKAALQFFYHKDQYIN
jgi:DNA-binding GntR family transcriptional regulator